MTSYQFAACINDMRSAAVALTSAEPPAKHTRQSFVATAAAAPQVVHYPAVNQVDYLTDPAVFVLAVNFFDKQLTTLGWKEKVKTQAAAQSARTSLVAVPSENFGEIPGQRSARQRNIANMSGFDSVLHNEIIKHALLPAGGELATCACMNSVKTIADMLLRGAGYNPNVHHRSLTDVLNPTAFYATLKRFRVAPETRTASPPRTPAMVHQPTEPEPLTTHDFRADSSLALQVRLEISSLVSKLSAIGFMSGPLNARPLSSWPNMIDRTRVAKSICEVLYQAICVALQSKNYNYRVNKVLTSVNKACNGLPAAALVEEQRKEQYDISQIRSNPVTILYPEKSIKHLRRSNCAAKRCRKLLRFSRSPLP